MRERSNDDNRMITFRVVQKRNMCCWFPNVLFAPANKVCEGKVRFYTCLSFCSRGRRVGGGCWLPSMTSGDLPPWRVCKSGGICIRGGGFGRPFCDTMGYGQSVGGRHPTGMHSCITMWLVVCAGPDIYFGYHAFWVESILTSDLPPPPPP